MPGFMSGTERYMMDGVMEIPGYINPPPGSLLGKLFSATSNQSSRSLSPSYGGSNTSMSDAGSNTSMSDAVNSLPPEAQDYFWQLYDQNPAMAGNPVLINSALSQAQGAWRREQIANANDARGSGGPDHFYEQQAAAAEQFAKERADAIQLANITQAGVQQKAINDWKAAQLNANENRQQRITNAATAGQSNAVSAIPYMSRDQGPVWVNWGAPAMASAAGYGPNPDPNASDANTPNLPGLVYPEGWGQ